MIADVVGLDHVVVSTHDINEDSKVLERIGFALTPLSHISTMGLANRLILLTSSVASAANFVEIMTITQSTATPPAMSALLAGAGPCSTVLASRDAQSTAASLRAAGSDLGPPQHVRRLWRFPDGSEVWPEFDVILPRPGGLPLNYCQYRNVELYHDDRWADHGNGAIRLVSVGVRSAHPEATATRLADLSDGTVTARDHAWVVATGTGCSYVVRAGGEGEAYDGVVVAVRSLEATARYLVDNDIPHRRTGGTLQIAAEDSASIGITFCANTIGVTDD